MTRSNDNDSMVAHIVLLAGVWYTCLGFGYCVFVLLYKVFACIVHTAPGPAAPSTPVVSSETIKPVKPQSWTTRQHLAKLVKSGDKLTVRLGDVERKQHVLFTARYTLFKSGVPLSVLVRTDPVTDRLVVNPECVGVVRKTISGKEGLYDIADLCYDLEHGYLAVVEAIRG